MGEPFKFVYVAKFETCDAFRYLSCHSGTLETTSLYETSLIIKFSLDVIGRTLKQKIGSHMKIGTTRSIHSYTPYIRAEVEPRSGNVRLEYAFIINIIISIIIRGKVGTPYIRWVGACHCMAWYNRVLKIEAIINNVACYFEPCPCVCFLDGVMDSIL